MCNFGLYQFFKMSKTNRSSQPNSDVYVAKLSFWQAILSAIIGGIITLGGIYIAQEKSDEKKDEKEKIQINVVPKQNPTLVEELPIEENNTDDYNLIKDISVFDLRNWKYTPEIYQNQRYSPVNYTNYLHVKKLKPVDYIVAHYSTSGYAIDMRCITHIADFFVQKDQEKFHQKSREKQYALKIDVSKVPVGKEFLIVLEGTYWNSFNDTIHGDASTYTDKEVLGMEELGLIVLFPERKPFRNIDYFNTVGDKEETSYLSNSSKYEDKKKRFVYWSIFERSPNNHYTIKWDW